MTADSHESAMTAIISNVTAVLDDHVTHDSHPVNAVIFPWFTVFLGLIAYYGITRSFPHLPYTVAMFIIGVAMGAGSAYSTSSGSSDVLNLTESVNMWTPIDSHVLFLVFLPGLVFRDSYNLNVFQFLVGLPQSLVLAFPAVLTGTLLVGTCNLSPQRHASISR